MEKSYIGEQGEVMKAFDSFSVFASYLNLSKNNVDNKYIRAHVAENVHHKVSDDFAKNNSDYSRSSAFRIRSSALSKFCLPDTLAVRIVQMMRPASSAAARSSAILNYSSYPPDFRPAIGSRTRSRPQRGICREYTKFSSIGRYFGSEYSTAMNSSGKEPVISGPKCSFFLTRKYVTKKSCGGSRASGL